jgi:hypothetical protein
MVDEREIFVSASVMWNLLCGQKGWPARSKMCQEKCSFLGYVFELTMMYIKAARLCVDSSSHPIS